MEVHSRHVARRRKRLCQLGPTWSWVRETTKLPHALDRKRASSQHRTSWQILWSSTMVKCQTLKYTVWTEFCSTLAASGAASGWVVHASGHGQKHHREATVINALMLLPTSASCWCVQSNVKLNFSNAECRHDFAQILWFECNASTVDVSEKWVGGLLGVSLVL